MTAGPTELIGQLEESITALGLSGRRILIAVSGGLDSTVLADGLIALASRRILDLAIGHVNHGLRGADSDADEAAVAALAARHDLPFRSQCVDVESLRTGVASRSRPTRQEAARTLRRDALSRMRTELGAHCIATAHHLDDQTETVLMRVIRGCGPDSVGGIREQSADGEWVRPLLSIPREQILGYARERDLTWREDQSNADPAYTRNRLRRDCLPGLIRDFNPQLLRAIGDLAEAQRRDSEWLDTLVDREARGRFLRTDAGLSIQPEGWQDLPEALARRLARWALVELGGGRDVSRVHLLRVLAFLREGVEGRENARLELPGGLILERRCRGFLLRAS